MMSAGRFILSELDDFSPAELELARDRCGSCDSGEKGIRTIRSRLTGSIENVEQSAPEFKLGHVLNEDGRAPDTLTHFRLAPVRRAARTEARFLTEIKRLFGFFRSSVSSLFPTEGGPFSPPPRVARSYLTGAA